MLDDQLLQRVQRRLMRFYGLDELPSVEAFARTSHEVERERLLVRESEGSIELALELPRTAAAPTTLDALCQLLEGVSHFVLLAERARRQLPTTQLELELQAEVDKYVLLALGAETPLARTDRDTLREVLFEDASFVDPEGTETGDRYRLANCLAMRFIHRLERDYLRRERHAELRARLRHFYCVGQTAKIALAAA